MIFRLLSTLRAAREVERRLRCERPPAADPPETPSTRALAERRSARPASLNEPEAAGVRPLLWSLAAVCALAAAVVLVAEFVRPAAPPASPDQAPLVAHTHPEQTPAPPRDATDAVLPPPQPPTQAAHRVARGLTGADLADDLARLVQPTTFVQPLNTQARSVGDGVRRAAEEWWNRLIPRPERPLPPAEAQQQSAVSAAGLGARPLA